MFKVGTGENRTQAGRVYLHKPTEREGEINWVYCQGKLYSHRANENLTQLMVTDPVTLENEGFAKLFAEDIFASSQSQSLNRYYPLLSDGTHLYIITMDVEKKQRRVKEEMKDEYVALQEEKKKKREEEKKAKEEALKKEQEEKKKEAEKQKNAAEKAEQEAGPNASEKQKRELKKKKIKEAKAEALARAE